MANESIDARSTIEYTAR